MIQLNQIERKEEQQIITLEKLNPWKVLFSFMKDEKWTVAD